MFNREVLDEFFDPIKIPFCVFSMLYAGACMLFAALWYFSQEGSKAPPEWMMYLLIYPGCVIFPIAAIVGSYIAIMKIYQHWQRCVINVYNKQHGTILCQVGPKHRMYHVQGQSCPCYKE